MLNVIIFSRDRASQLELFLRSMKFYFKEFYDHKINILYTYSDDKYKKGYEKLFEIHNDSNINYVKESQEFKKHVLLLLDSNNPYSVFFVDDIVFKNPFTLESKQFKLFTLNDEILTLSLRLHPDLVFCYASNLRMNKPNFETNNVYKWIGQIGDFGYPMSLDGNFFRTNEITALTKVIPFNNPNSYESYLSFYPLNRPKMICFDESIIMNNPVNRVQTYNNNYHGNISASFLNDNFLSGKIIDLENFKGFRNVSCHQEMPINFIDYE
jgi:hypothetical protein